MNDTGVQHNRITAPDHSLLPGSSFNPNSKAGQPRDEHAPVFITHEQQPPMLAVEYFNRAQISPTLIDSVFNGDSLWNIPADSTVRHYDMSPAELMKFYLGATKDVYTLAQHSLAQVNWFGYNDHGPLHIRRVCEAAMRIGNEAGFQQEEFRRVIAGAAFHDLGNLVNRDVHSWESPEIALALFPSLQDDVGSWKIIERAIQAHELGTHKIFLRDVTDVQATDRISAMRDVFRDEGLALLIADKIQFTRERINDRALSPEAVLAHRYTQLNLYWSTSSASYVPDQKAFVWDLTFRPQIFASEMERYGALAREHHADGGLATVVVPQKFDEALRESNKTYFSSAQELFWDLSTKLVRRVIEASFALFDARGENGMEQFVLRFIDAEPMQGEKNVHEFRFSVADLDNNQRLRL